MKKTVYHNDIVVSNFHAGKRVFLSRIKKLARKILEGEDKNEKLNIVFVDDKFMRGLNRKFTKRISSTDVLSFGMKEGKNMGVECDVLGDVYVNLDQAEKNAKSLGQKFEDEVKLLVTHGILHLLGYDHKGKKNAMLMRKKEDFYLDLKKENR